MRTVRRRNRQRRLERFFVAGELRVKRRLTARWRVSSLSRRITCCAPCWGFCARLWLRKGAGAVIRMQRKPGHCYLAIRSFDRLVPIWLKVVTIWFDDVSRKNLSELLAQFCSRVDVGSPSVFTWTV
jgi:hypothetical protein